MDIVESRTKFLQELISSFYELSRIEGNEYKFNYQKLNLSELLCSNIALFYNDFVQQSIEPVIEIAEHVPDIICDEGAVNRIFSNLINNMLKHGHKFVKITLKKEADLIKTEFINSAPDLTEDDLGKIFDRFYTNKKGYCESVGIGLSLAKNIIEKNNGKIDVYSKDGKTIFTIKYYK